MQEGLSEGLSEGVRRSRGKVTDRDQKALAVLRVIDLAQDTTEDPVLTLMRLIPDWRSRRSVRSWIQRNLQGDGALVRSTWATDPRPGHKRRRATAYTLTPRGERELRRLNKQEPEGQPEGFSDAQSHRQPEGHYQKGPTTAPNSVPIPGIPMIPGIQSTVEGYRVRFPILDPVPDHRDLPDPWLEDDQPGRPRNWRRWILSPEGVSWTAIKTTQAIEVRISKVIGGHPWDLHNQVVATVDRVADYVARSTGINLGPGELIRGPETPHREVLVPGLDHLLDQIPGTHIRILDQATGEILTVDRSSPGPSVGADTLETLGRILKSPQEIDQIRERLAAWEAVLVQIARIQEISAQAISQATEIELARSRKG